jgi:hypothetical protein
VKRFSLRVWVLVFCCLTGWAICRADELAAVTGLVTDPNGRSVPGVTVLITNLSTNVASKTVTNDQGIYRVSYLQPGIYRMSLDKDGFKSIVKSGVELHVQDVASINFELQIGSVNETVTVEAGASMINTTDASVSTVVDQTYVKNMPLNGRSFQDLILLTPGVTTNTPQRTGAPGGGGEFNVNGQRTEANYYTVDGVSANIGTFPATTQGPGNSGSVGVGTAQGTTQSLVSVDALQEFRVQSSTYSAEYGRNPGGQFSFVTRSGTNQWHGTAFDYLRNNVFDANDWFNNFLGKAEPPLRQNDFGGTLGGPIEIPRVYNGKDKSFFFFSYEGLRLIQPQAASISNVPTAALRSSTPAPLQTVLNAFPLPNCPVSSLNCSNDLGNGLGQFIGTWSNPSQIDAYSIRLDHALSNRVRLFFRFSDTPSTVATRGSVPLALVPSSLTTASYTARTYTLGASSLLSSRVSNEFRMNFSSNDAISSQGIDSFGGGQAVDLAKLQGIDPAAGPAYLVDVFLQFPGFRASISQNKLIGLQRQWNFVDAISLSLGRHQLKFGIDYRRLTPTQRNSDPEVDYFFFSQKSVQANNVDSGSGFAFGPAFPIYTNFSAFAQDEWRITPRLSLSMGLRWEVNPAPGARDGRLPYTVQGSSLSTLTLAPQGTPLWKTTWYNVAPRLGAAFVLRSTPGWETVVRGGGGVFFDTGQQPGSIGYTGPGFFAFTFFGGTSFPVPLAQATPALVNPPMEPITDAAVTAFPHLLLPYTLQTNASVEQALGKSQALTISYVGAFARKLVQQDAVNPGAVNPNFVEIDFYRNVLTADYNALQVQFQRRFSRGLQALASYTLGHSIDYGSFNVAFPYERGNSDFDIRHNFSGALSYDVPNRSENGFARAMLHHWGIDNRFTARTGFPVTLNGRIVTDPVTGQMFNGGLNTVSGQALYVYGPQYPGGRSINPAAFGIPGPNQFGDAPRNFVRGFGTWQMDLAVRREFPIYERLKVQVRAEAFNVFNHPNFGTINSIYCPAGRGCTFGQASGTLAQGLGALSPLYQMGGPRSMQFALKLVF